MERSRVAPMMGKARGLPDLERRALELSFARSTIWTLGSEPSPARLVMDQSLNLPLRAFDQLSSDGVAEPRMTGHLA